MTEKTPPIRKCVSCATHKFKHEFLAVIRPPKSSNDTTFKIINGDEKKEGRGAYICKNAECIKRAAKNKKLEKIFKKQLNPEIYKTLEEAVISNEQ